ncbi:MAG: DUF3365 domain-containing protein [Proteobacteria bacterium]|nr:DUF3365 domain-containing protein [Pseudomonadota bacterium]MCP4918902.1 DUF3365 domain-containing protein [Pseudomonadota bacterium]
MLLAVLIACSSDPAPAPAPVAEAPPAAPRDSKAEAKALADANGLLSELGQSFRSRLSEELKARGPVAAVEVCSTEAQALTAALSASSGGSVGRSSSKLRNPANEGPDWVRAWLADADASTAGLSEVVDGRARVLKPITIEPACLTCHGTEIGAEVQTILGERYPDDAATGYAVGDLRGVAWADVPVR